MGISTSGAQRGVVGSTGNFGLGNFAPVGRCHIGGADSVNLLTVSGATASVRLGGNVGTGYLDAVDASGVGAFTPLVLNGSTVVLAINNSGRLTVGATGDVTPGLDNAQNLGSGAARFATVFAGTGTINTSDAREKTLRPELAAQEDALLAAILSVPLHLFQWNDAVALKGAAGARLHYGPTAQAVAQAIGDAGLDPARFALFCEDPLFETVKVTKLVTRQKVEARTVSDLEVEETEAGRVARVIQREVIEPVFDLLPVVDAAGAPVLNEKGEPLLHPVPVMEEVEIEVEEQQPTGEVRLGLRLDQFDRLRTEAVRRLVAGA